MIGTCPGGLTVTMRLPVPAALPSETTSATDRADPAVVPAVKTTVPSGLKLTASGAAVAANVR